MPDLTELRTERLRLRVPTLADTSRVVALSTDPRVNRHSPMGAPTVEQSRAAVRDAIAAWRRDRIGHWLVECDGRLAGIAGVRPVTVQGDEYWNVYYRFAPETWGKGIASEAVRAALAAARGRLPGRRFIVRTRPTNEAAMQLAQAVGLTRSPQLDSERLRDLRRDLERPVRFIRAGPATDRDERQPVRAGVRLPRLAGIDPDEAAKRDRHVVVADPPAAGAGDHDHHLLLSGLLFVVLEAVGARWQLVPVDPERLDAQLTPHKAHDPARTGAFDLIDVDRRVRHDHATVSPASGAAAPGLGGPSELAAVAGGDRATVQRERLGGDLCPVEAQHVFARLGDQLGAERVVGQDSLDDLLQRRRVA